MKILVINSGSSSIKYQLFDMTAGAVLASGLLEQIGEPESRLAHQTRNAGGDLEEITKAQPVADHQEGIRLINAVLREAGDMRDAAELSSIGHRVVYGGEEFEEERIVEEKISIGYR